MAPRKGPARHARSRFGLALRSFARTVDLHHVRGHKRRLHQKVADWRCRP